MRYVLILLALMPLAGNAQTDHDFGSAMSVWPCATSAVQEAFASRKYAHIYCSDEEGRIVVDGLLPIERWANVLAEYHLQEIWLEKMPDAASLDPPEGPAAVAVPLRVVNSDWHTGIDLQIPVQPPATLGPRALVSFSPGLRVGKDSNGYDVWAWKVVSCNQQEVPLSLDAGDVQSAATAAGISYVDEDDAQIANGLSRSKSGPIIGTQAAQGAAGLFTGLLAMKIIAASSLWGAVGFGVTYGSSALVNYFKSVSPPDFATEFAGQEVLLDNTSFSLAPIGQSGHCATKVIFARTKKGAAPVGRVPIP